jgi:LacI family transcriptional regulator
MPQGSPDREEYYMPVITIKDIAKQAGVSVATVSYVINKSRFVSEELTGRVLEAIEELGYSPNAIARSLRQKSTKMIGLIVPDSSNPFFAEIAKGVEDAGYESGYSVILCNSNASIERELVYLNLLHSKRVEGIIFFATTTQVEQIHPFVKAGIPVVIFYRDMAGVDVDTFRIDNFHAGYLATEYLIRLGHNQIACIQPASPATPSGLRVEGYKHALKEAGLAWNEKLMPRGDNRVSGGKAAAEVLAKGGQSFSAIFSTNDAMAIGAIRTLREFGYQVPDQVSIVGVDDIILASYTEPPLTTVAQPKYQAGCQAVQFLIQRIEGGYNEGPRSVQLEIKLVERSSALHYKLSQNKQVNHDHIHTPTVTRNL